MFSKFSKFLKRADHIIIILTASGPPILIDIVYTLK